MILYVALIQHLLSSTLNRECTYNNKLFYAWYQQKLGEYELSRHTQTKRSERSLMLCVM